MNCRHCGTALDLPFADLGSAPPSNAYLSEQDLHAPEMWFPLRVLVCRNCWLVQTEDFAKAEQLFDARYAYFSGVSTSWQRHCADYSDEMIDFLGLDSKSLVVEIASNDGTLLENFSRAGIASIGVEPTASTAAAARSKGLHVVEEFFGKRAAERLAAASGRADLIAANNVLAHVPDINDFVAGFPVLLKPGGIATFEFPHLMRLVEGNQFDTIYHEHFSYLSLSAVDRIFATSGLAIVDVRQLPTHGGSLRVYCERNDSRRREQSSAVADMLRNEREAGMLDTVYYIGFQRRIEKVKDEFVAFLLDARRQGKSVAAYGAAAKGNTLLNFAGIRPDLCAFVADASPHKQGRFLPGSRIPIVSEDMIKQGKPDLIAILPWNLRDEITGQLAYVRDWGGRFFTAVPRLEVF